MNLLVNIYIAFVIYFFLAINEGMIFRNSANYRPKARCFSYFQLKTDVTGVRIGLAITQSLSLVLALQLAVRCSMSNNITILFLSSDCVFMNC